MRTRVDALLSCAYDPHIIVGTWRELSLPQGLLEATCARSRTGTTGVEFLWHAWVKGAKYGDLPNTMPIEALEEDDDAEPAVPNPGGGDPGSAVDAPPAVSAVVAQQAAMWGVINANVIDEIAGEMSAPDEEEDVSPGRRADFYAAAGRCSALGRARYALYSRR